MAKEEVIEVQSEPRVDAVSFVKKQRLFGFSVPAHTTTQRRLTSRQSHLLAMGECIGTALFVLIRSALQSRGPLFLFLSYLI